MVKNFSIVTTLDLSELDRQIWNYGVEYKNDPYIFMNNATESEIIKQRSFNFKTIKHTYCDCGISKYYSGCKVFIDPTLAYGEIELR